MCLAHGELLGNEGKEGAMRSFTKGFLYNFLDISISGYKQNVELFKNFENENDAVSLTLWSSKLSTALPC